MGNTGGQLAAATTGAVSGPTWILHPGCVSRVMSCRRRVSPTSDLNLSSTPDQQGRQSQLFSIGFPLPGKANTCTLPACVARECATPETKATKDEVGYRRKFYPRLRDQLRGQRAGCSDIVRVLEATLQ